MLTWIFGGVKQNIVHLHKHDRAAGFLEFERARVRWFLSINADILPVSVREKGQRTYRSITIEKKLSSAMALPICIQKSYQQILEGKGFTLMETVPSIELSHDIRTKTPVGLKGDYHPLTKLPLAQHPATL